MKPVVSHRSHPGFALVVTISLMVLLALLAVGLLSLSTISLRSSSQTTARAEARANARLALTLAIAELQRTAGPDQRVTATANIAAGTNGSQAEAGADPLNDKALDGSSKNLSPVQPGTRHWTGVFRNAHPPDDIFTKTPAATALQWLVSGTTEAERQPGNPACTVDATGAVADPEKAAVLVGRNSVGHNASDQYVAAPKVGIRDGQRPTGSFAYWVGDEGVKARLDMHRSPTPSSEPPLAIAQRRGWETVPGFESYPTPTNGEDAGLARIATLPSAPLLLSELSQGNPSPLQQAFHSATVNSQGVIADTLDGGTRIDLSTALADDLPASLSQEVYKNDPVAGNPVIPPVPNLTDKLTGLSWERLREFYQLHEDLDGGTLVVRQGNSNQSTIAPTVIDFRILMGVRLTRTSGRDEKYRLFGSGKVAVAIANPYSVPMEWNRDLEFEVKNLTPPGNRPSRIWQHQQCVFIPQAPGSSALRSGIQNPDVPSSESAVFNQAVFTIPAGRLDPGEARAYTVARNVTRSAGTANRQITVPMASFDRSSPFDFNNSVEMDSGVEVTLPRSMDIRESWQTTLVMLEMRLAGSRSSFLRRYHGFELDNGYFQPNTRQFTSTEARNYARGPIPLMLYSFQLSQPGMRYKDLMPGGYEIGQRASTIRTYADFNLQADHWIDAIASYNPPPFFMESNDSIGQLGNSPGNTGPGFTRNLAFSPLNWGYSSAEGSTRTVLFDVPRRFTSLAQLQHADLTVDDEHQSVSVQPGNAFANSYAPVFVRRELVRQPRTDYVLMGSQNPSGAFQNLRNYYDISHILNSALWDRFFFSSIDPSRSEPLNPTMLVLDDRAEALRDPVQAAGNLMIDGAFNINSTDKNAWKAFLASARFFEHPDDSAVEAAFPRSLNQPVGATIPPSGTDEDSYAGFRRLSDQEIDRLADEIVRQVRLRGPFVSLSHFVNRALASLRAEPQLSRAGALQVALDESGVNLSIDGRRSGFDLRLDPNTDRVTFAWKQNAPRADLDGGDTGGRPPDANSREPDWAVTSRDNNFGAVASIVAERDTLTSPRSRSEQGYRSTGIPGWLTQADVLQVIGPSISARSDTFKIRAMGEARDASGKVTAIAYCEAVVQRLPDYVDPSNPPHARGPALSAANQTYGRRFTITSFRWLASSEI